MLDQQPALEIAQLYPPLTEGQAYRPVLPPERNSGEKHFSHRP